MEVLGTYDPVPRVPLATDTPDTVDNHETDLPRPLQKRYKKIQLDTSRTKYWLGVGAQPSEPVWRLFSLVRLTNVVFPQRGRAKRGEREVADGFSGE